MPLMTYGGKFQVDPCLTFGSSCELAPDLLTRQQKRVRDVPIDKRFHLRLFSIGLDRPAYVFPICDALLNVQCSRPTLADLEGGGSHMYKKDGRVASRSIARFIPVGCVLANAMSSSAAPSSSCPDGSALSV